MRKITRRLAARTARQRIAIAGMLTVNVSTNYKKLSRHALPRQQEELGVYANPYVLAPSWIARRVTSIGMARARRSTNVMDVVVTGCGCSTFCNSEHGYGNGSASMRTRNGSRGRNRLSCSARTLVRRSGRRGANRQNLPPVRIRCRAQSWPKTRRG